MARASNDISDSPAERVRQALLRSGSEGAARAMLEEVPAILASCDDPRQRIDIRHAVSQYHCLHGNNERAIACLDDADKDAGNDLSLRALVAYARGCVLNRQFALEEARSVLAPFVTGDLALADPHVAARVHTLYAGVLDSLGEAVQSNEQYQTAIRLREQIGDPHGLAVVYYNFAESCVRRDENDVALEFFVRAYDIEKGLDDHASVAQSACHIAIIMARQGEVHEAERFADVAIESARRSGMPVIIAHVMSNRASMFEILGRAADREAALRDTLAYLEDHPCDAIHGPTLGNLGTMCLEAGRLEEAERHLTRALSWAIENGYRYNEGFWRFTLGRLHLEREDPNAAIVELDQAVQILRSVKAHQYTLEALHLLATAHARCNSTVDAFMRLADWSDHYARDHQAELEQRVHALDELRRRERSEREEEIYRLRNVELSAALDELKRVNAELRDLALEKDEFMTIAAHDLRNPLSDSRSMLQTIISHFDVLDKSDVLSLCADLLTLTMRMSNTVHAFLEISRTDQRSTGLVIQPLDLSLIAHRAVERHETRARSKGITLVTVVRRQHVWGTGDASVMEAIVDNLVTNAIKYVPSGAVVSIDVDEDENGPLLAVRDNGPGVDPDKTHLLFTKYSSIGSKPTGGEESLGLGLYLSQRMATRMAAKISYDPAPFGGSIFTVRLMH